MLYSCSSRLSVMSLPRGRVLGLAMLALVLLCLSQVPHAQTADPREAIVQHHLEFIPSGDGPFPTIVAIPGCSGIAFADAEREANHPGLADDDRLFRRHYREVSRRLRDAGYAVYLIDVHGAEGVLTACAGEISGERLGEHIDEAVAWAAERSQVDSSRMHIIGWSMGGWGVLAWLHGPRSEEEAVKSAVAVYPGCHDREPLTSTVPLLVLLGDADDVARPSLCEELIARSPGARVMVERYPGARHGFDAIGAPEVLEIGDGMTVGYQESAAAASWKRILAFLSERD